MHQRLQLVHGGDVNVAPSTLNNGQVSGAAAGPSGLNPQASGSLPGPGVNLYGGGGTGGSSAFGGAGGGGGGTSGVTRNYSRLKEAAAGGGSGGGHHGRRGGRRDSGGSSDRLSLDHANHLRRGGYVAPVNSAGVSEVDYVAYGFGGAPSSVLCGAPRSLLTSGGRGHGAGPGAGAAEKAPRTSSPAAGGVPPQADQDLTLSPLSATPRGDDTAVPAFPPRPSNNVTSAATAPSADTRGEYTESPTVRVGAPCQLASFAVGDFARGESDLSPMPTVTRQSPAVKAEKQAVRRRNRRRPIAPSATDSEQEEEEAAVGSDEEEEGRDNDGSRMSEHSGVNSSYSSNR